MTYTKPSSIDNTTLVNCAKCGDELRPAYICFNCDIKGGLMGERKPTDIKDKNGDMIYFGDKVRFADKVEWYRGTYFGKLIRGEMTKAEALKEIETLPYEEREVENVQDYEWLLSSEIQTYWEIVK